MIRKTKNAFKILLLLVVLAAPVLILGSNNISLAAKEDPYTPTNQRNTAATTTATQYTPMEEIPGFGKPTDFYDYITAIYKFGIGAVGICAMLMIIVGGYMYATSAGNNASMEKAKGVITDAIVGLLLALSSYLILYVINPDLVKIKRTSSMAPIGAMVGREASASCTEIPTQVPGQCSDASPQLNSLLACVTKEVGKDNLQISSISDGNGGVACYSKYSIQCTQDPQTNCCYHTKNSCHYGGKNCSDGSHAVDFSAKGSSTSNSTIKSAVIKCGGQAKDESNHVHASIGGINCGCDVNLY